MKNNFSGARWVGLLTYAQKYFIQISVIGVLIFLFASQTEGQQLLDSVKKYRSNQPDKALAFARQACQRAATKELKAKGLLTLGVLNSDVSHYDSAFYYLKAALQIFQTLHDSSGMADVYHNIGVADEDSGKYPESLDAYTTAYTIRRKLGLQSAVASSLNGMGNACVFLNNYPRALKLYIASLEISQVLENKIAIANAFNNIGMVYDYTSDLNKALDYYDRSRKAYEDLNDPRGLAGALNNIGLIYKNKKQPARSISYYKKSLNLFEGLKSDYGVAALQNNLGVAYDLMNNPALALQYHKQSLATNTKIDNVDGIANSNNSMGDCYLKLHQFLLADSYFRKGLVIAQQIKSNDRLAESYEGLSKAREGLKDFRPALDFSRQARILRDTLYSAEKSQKLYEMEQKYESALKEKQIALLNSESEKQKLEITRKDAQIDLRNLQLLLVLISIIFLGVAIYLFYSRLRLKQTISLTAAVQTQRSIISKDMHDEIGSGLTHIALLSELISTQKKSETEIQTEVKTIASTSRQLVQSMSEIIWAINPEHETLENLVAYLREQTNAYFEPFDVRFTFHVLGDIPAVVLTNIQRRNLFLITKETLNNALKHAHASVISLTINIYEKAIHFRIVDNGKGFEFEKIRRSANGLKNMKSRMEEIGGSFDIVSNPNGTTLAFAMPIAI